ncbi:50S ribosomal protein L23 [Candidatus Saccharibacteria bacterium CPR2]|nr:50S ribosomal protein L23 [Candidatus Saccharibacteria bacterium CPR2]
MVSESSLSPVAALPKISEKAYKSSDANQYVFIFPTNINKNQIKNIVQNQFNVTVTEVKTAIIKGKPKRTVSKRRSPMQGKRKDVKKAYVSLKKGDKIDIFEEGK